MARYLSEYRFTKHWNCNRRNRIFFWYAMWNKNKKNCRVTYRIECALETLLKSMLFCVSSLKTAIKLTNADISLTNVSFLINLKGLINIRCFQTKCKLCKNAPILNVRFSSHENTNKNILNGSKKHYGSLALVELLSSWNLIFIEIDKIPPAFHSSNLIYIFCIFHIG